MENKPKIGIIGVGMVGTPLMKWFLEEKKYKRDEDFFAYDVDPKKGYFDDVTMADILFLCVPTPPNPDGSCNTSIIESVVKNLPDAKRVIVIKSTVPPGATAEFGRKYKDKGYFLFNPEFLTETQAWVDFMRPDRQIVAAADENARKWTSTVLSLLPGGSFQSPGVAGTYQFHEAHSTEAEITKYSGNSFGATKVVFSNIIADFCELLDADYKNVRQLFGHDRRIGHAWTDVYYGNYRGFGGFCFPKDLNAMIALGEKLLKQLDQSDKRKKVFAEGLKFLKAVRSYNEVLLESQGLTVEEVSIHDESLKERLKQKK